MDTDLTIEGRCTAAQTVSELECQHVTYSYGPNFCVLPASLEVTTNCYTEHRSPHVYQPPAYPLLIAVRYLVSVKSLMHVCTLDGHSYSNTNLCANTCLVQCKALHVSSDMMSCPCTEGMLFSLGYYMGTRYIVSDECCEPILIATELALSVSWDILPAHATNHFMPLNLSCCAVPSGSAGTLRRRTCKCESLNHA